MNEQQEQLNRPYPPPVFWIGNGLSIPSTSSMPSSRRPLKKGGWMRSPISRFEHTGYEESDSFSYPLFQALTPLDIDGIRMTPIPLQIQQQPFSPKPMMLVGAGPLTSAIWKLGNEESGWRYRFNVVRQSVSNGGSARNEVRDIEMADSGRVDPCVWRSNTAIRPNGPRQVSLGQRPGVQRHQRFLP